MDVARDTGPGAGGVAERPVGERPADEPEGSDPRIERTRSAVLDAGVTLLFDEGPDAITHAAVATAARVSRTTLYKHWPTRGELVFDILNCVEPHKSVEPSGDVRADMLKMATNMAAAFADPRLNKVFVSLLAQAQWDDETSKVQDAIIASGMADIEVVIDAAVASGELAPGVDAPRAAGRLIGPIFFAALIARRPLESDEVEQLVDDWLAVYRA